MKKLPIIIINSLKKRGIKNLRPPQKLSIEKGVLNGKNLVISSPTSSGKTLIAEIAAIKHFESNGKTLYIVPLKSLASEKYLSFKSRYEEFGVKTAISIGNLDEQDPYLENYDIIISTSEKADSLIRHNAPVMRNISCVVIDEVHLINDEHRGPTLEILITRLREMLPNTQFIALSATINNDEELSEWLNAELVKSNYRPVKLYEGVALNDKLIFEEKTCTIEKKSREEFSIAHDTLNKKKQAIFFLGTRRNCEAMARNLSNKVEKFLSDEEKGKLEIIADKILYSLEQPTEQCRKLSEYIRLGSAFHHAGLMNKQRNIVEQGFRDRLIKIICATPTLCLSKDAKIWHNVSETKVSKFNISHPLFALSDNKLIRMNAKEINKTPCPNKLVEISSVSGNSIKVTPNHKMLVKRNNKKLIIIASKVKKEDKIATMGKLNISHINYPTISEFVLKNKTNTNCSIDENISYLIGAMLGDGYSGAEKDENNKIRYKCSPYIVGNDEEIFSPIIKACKKLNVSCKPLINYYEIPQLRLEKSKWFREFLVNCGVEKSNNKYVSNKLMKMNLKNISALLKGLFDTDGYVNKNKCVGYSSISIKLIKNVQKLLLRFGIVSRLRKRKRGKMNIYEKEYETKPNFELIISQKKNIIDFYNHIGFNIKRKQKNLFELVSKINSNLKYISCNLCKYKIYKELFTGRTKEQKQWGKIKLKVIKLLGKKEELGSREIKKILNHEPKKNENRLNHHYELIKKRKIGKISKNEWFWSLNQIGKWIYSNIIKNEIDFNEFFNKEKCPICKKHLKKVIKKGWRDSDFEGDIFWDIVRESKIIETNDSFVYDIVLPNKPLNNHLFVANGFIVHNSAGINLPAFRVVVRDLTRFSQSQGRYFIPVLEVKQMCGRAGRPGLEEYGEALLIARSEEQKNSLFKEYINGEVESVYSKLGVEPVLRTHVLALIANRFTVNFKSLKNFFSKTFFAKQYKNMSTLYALLETIISMLRRNNFIEKAEDNFYATPLGSRVSELYLDPLSASKIIESINKSKHVKADAFSILQALCFSGGIRNLRINNKEVMDINKLIETNTLLVDEPNPFDYEYDNFIRSIKTTLLFEEWINETTQQSITENFKVFPGDLRNYIYNMDWLLYSLVELSKILKIKEVNATAKRLRTRIAYGIKDELFTLVSLKGIGRVRARKLYNKGIKSFQDILNSPFDKIAEIVGPTIAKKIRGN